MTKIEIENTERLRKLIDAKVELKNYSNLIGDLGFNDLDKRSEAADSYFHLIDDIDNLIGIEIDVLYLEKRQLELIRIRDGLIAKGINTDKLQTEIIDIKIELEKYE